MNYSSILKHLILHFVPEFIHNACKMRQEFMLEYKAILNCRVGRIQCTYLLTLTNVPERGAIPWALNTHSIVPCDRAFHFIHGQPFINIQRVYHKGYKV